MKSADTCSPENCARTGGKFLHGVSLLTLSAVAVKAVGLAYRIPMLRVLGTAGMGYFNTAYEVYALLCVLSTAGLPVAMSVLLAGGDGTPAHRALSRRIFHVSLAVFCTVGALGTAALLLPARLWADMLGNPDAAACIRAVSPAVLAVCLAGAARGYFQGLSDMKPTAVSQVIEALGKLILGLAFASLAARRGASLPETAACAVLGLTVGTAASAVWLLCRRARQDRRSGAALPAGVPDAPLPGRRCILRRLAAVALPVTLSAGVISLTKCVDLALILHRLQDAGLSGDRANALYGCYSTLAVPVFNILPSLSASVAMSLVPVLSGAVRRLRSGNPARECAEAAQQARRTAAGALGLTLAFAVPAGLGLFAMGGDVLTLLFRGQPEAVAEATPWLRLLGLAVPSACLITVTGAMLQAAGHAAVPAVSMLVGTAVKAVLAYRLLALPGWGMIAAPVSSLCCDTLILLCNCVFLACLAPDILPRGRVLAGLFLLPAVLALPAVALAPRLCACAGLDGNSVPEILCRIGGTALLYGAGVAAVCLPAVRYFKNGRTNRT